MRINHSIQAEGVKPLGKYDSLKEKNISLLIMTPTLDGSCSFEYALSLAQSCVVLQAAGVNVTIGRTQNSCFVHHSRNLIANAFLNSTNTHLLQIDSDMSWEPHVILDMLLFDKEFIAGIGRKKSLDVEFAGTPLTDETGGIVGQLGATQEDAIVKMKHIGGAFTLHKKSVFEKMRNTTLQSNPTGFVFYKDEYDLITWKTEDYRFCEKCHEIGIDIWCYPNIKMGHLGNYDYSGSYFDYLKKGVVEKPKDLSCVLDAIKNIPGVKEAREMMPSHLKLVDGYA